jgi:hypothetical protein
VSVTSATLLLVAILGTPPAASDAPRLPDEVVSDTLAAMHERPIGKLASSERAFRFLWLRSFHKPILIGIEEQGHAQFLTVKMLDRPWGIGVGGVQIGKLTHSHRRPLTEAEWRSVAELGVPSFWRRAASEPESRGVDGADWILEGVNGGEHQILTRWCPAPGAFREVCLAMLRLSGVAVAPNEVY